MALEAMPPPPMTARSRVRLGLTHVDLPNSEKRRVKAERSARALVAILPYGAAGIILSDPAEVIAARPARDTAEAMVRVLSDFGPGILDSAASAYGRLLTWVADHMPSSSAIHGTELRAFYEAVPPSQSTVDGLEWLRDHAGLDLPVRTDAVRRFRTVAPTSSNDDESLTFATLLGLEHLMASHPNRFVRGHAAGWYAMAKCLLRHEQASSCTIISFFPHTFQGAVYTILFGGVLRDKHPDQSKQRPRPFWGCVDGIREREAPRRELSAMLLGAEGARSLLLDTDSPNGDPSHPSTSTFVRTPISEGHRADASLQSLLRLIGLPADLSSSFHRHACKRCLINAVDHSSSFRLSAHALGRFSKSMAQQPDLEPTEVLLQRHALACDALPAIYAGKSRVLRSLDLVAGVESMLHAASQRAHDDPSRLSYVGGWDIFRGL